MHKMSSGKPYLPDGDLGEFEPKGEPKSVQTIGKADPQEPEAYDHGDAADKALQEFAGIAKASKSSSVKANTKVPISLEPDALATSVYNRPGGQGGTAD